MYFPEPLGVAAVHGKQYCRLLRNKYKLCKEFEYYEFTPGLSGSLVSQQPLRFTNGAPSLELYIQTVAETLGTLFLDHVYRDDSRLTKIESTGVSGDVINIGVIRVCHRVSRDQAEQGQCISDFQCKLKDSATKTLSLIYSGPVTVDIFSAISICGSPVTLETVYISASACGSTMQCCQCRTACIYGW